MAELIKSDLPQAVGGGMPEHIRVQKTKECIDQLWDKINDLNERLSAASAAIGGLSKRLDSQSDDMDSFVSGATPPLYISSGNVYLRYNSTNLVLYCPQSTW